MFANMPIRRVLLIQACLCLLTALGMLSLLLLGDDMSATVRVLGYSFVAFLCLFGAYRLWQRTLVPVDAMMPSVGPPPHYQQDRYVFELLFVIIFFSVITWFTVTNLNKLESGVVDGVCVWEPVASLYESFGYWAATLIFPACGVLSLLLIVYRLRKLIKNDVDR
jgi:hypothetical protein